MNCRAGATRRSRPNLGANSNGLEAIANQTTFQTVGKRGAKRREALPCCWYELRGMVELTLLMSAEPGLRKALEDHKDALREEMRQR